MRNFPLVLLLSGVAFIACDDDTSMVGFDVMPEGDNVVALDSVFEVTTRTVEVDSVLANTATCYLGSIVDPETRLKTTSGFLAQFHLPEDFKLPKIDLMVKGTDGLVEADSCDVRLYIDSFYGDSLATMKLHVQELDKNKVLEETKSYYTNLDPADYVSENTPYQKTLTYAVKDLTRPESETNGQQYYRQIAVKLPAQYGTELLRSYYEHPEYFANSYQFIHNVCPGFYFKSAGGVGSMVKSAMMAMNVYFRYHSTTEAGNDTIIDGMQRFGATEEVIQTTQVDNEYPGSLTFDQIAQQGYTYVKSPANFFTELTLPVSDIVDGSHYRDSINMAKITVRAYEKDASSKLALNAPEYLLMVRKTKMKSFFENNQLPNSTDSYLSSKYGLQSGTMYNYYQFTNIAQLITDLKVERDQGAGVVLQDDEATRKAKYAVWEADNPDWNKVYLVPIEPTYTQSTSIYGSTSYVLRSVKNQLGLTSVRLEGGKDVPLEMQVIYSRYNR